MNSRAEQQPTRVLPLVANQGNRQLLTGWLDEHETYQPVALDDEPLRDASFELAIIDEGAFREHLDALRARKEAAAPVLLPYLLLLPESRSGLIQADRGVLADGVVASTIDEVVLLPIKQAELEWRIKSLLRLREQSLSLQRRSERLAEERQFADRLFETSPVAKLVFDTDDTIIRANRRAEDLLGLERSDEDGRVYEPPAWHVTDETGEPIPRDDLGVARVMASGEPVYDEEIGIEWPDGTVKWFAASLAPVRDDGGEIQYLLSELVDITERTQLERELRESEELHRLTLDNILDTVFITDDDGRFTYVCSNVDNIFGYTREEIMAMETVESLLGDRLVDAADLGREGSVENIEHTVTDVNGEVHDVLVTVNRVSIRQGTRLYTVRDVTELAAAEHARGEIEESRELALQAAQAGVWEWDLETGEVRWDESCERLFGLEPGTFGGTMDAVQERLHPDDRDDVADAFRRAVDRDEPFQVTFRIERPDGQRRWIDGRGRLLTDDDGTHTSLLGVAMDITERQWRLQQLRVLDRLLRHNFRNDMNVIRGYAEVIQHTGTVEGTADQIIQHCDRLLEAVEKQRKITKILSSDERILGIDLVSLVERVVERVGDEHPQADIEVDLPEESSVHAIAGLDDALRELLGNAIVHSDRDRPQVRLAVEAGATNVRIRIADDGPGIPEVEREVVSGEADIGSIHHGSGLGLWLIWWVVHRSGGTLSFEDNQPRGSVVTITLQPHDPTMTELPPTSGGRQRSD